MKKQSGLLKVPPKLYQKALQLLEDQYAVEKEKKSQGETKPLSFYDKQQVRHTLPLDVTDFDYVKNFTTEEFLRRLREKRKNVYEEIKTRIENDPKWTSELRHEFAKIRSGFIRKWFQLTINFKSYIEGGYTIGFYSFNDNSITLMVNPELVPLSKLKRTLEHELQHMVQFMLSDFHKKIDKFKDGVVSFGLPKRKARNPDFKFDQEGDSYYLSDEEFQTQLGDVLYSFKRNILFLEKKLKTPLEKNVVKDLFFYVVGWDSQIKDKNHVLLFQSYKIRPDRDSKKFVTTLLSYAKKNSSVKEKLKLFLKEVVKHFP